MALDSVVDLEGGLRLEIKTSPESFTGIWIGFDKALDVGQHSLVADVVLEEDAS
jgi:hypothetical protein